MKHQDFTSKTCQIARSMAMTRARHMCEHIDDLGNRCASCLDLDAHHLIYHRYGEELPEDLMILCRNHHIKIHGR